MPHRSGETAALVTNLEREVLAPVDDDHFDPRVGLPLGDGSSRVLEQFPQSIAHVLRHVGDLDIFITMNIKVKIGAIGPLGQLLDIISRR